MLLRLLRRGIYRIGESCNSSGSCSGRILIKQKRHHLIRIERMTRKQILHKVLWMRRLMYGLTTDLMQMIKHHARWKAGDLMKMLLLLLLLLL